MGEWERVHGNAMFDSSVHKISVLLNYIPTYGSIYYRYYPHLIAKGTHHEKIITYNGAQFLLFSFRLPVCMLMSNIYNTYVLLCVTAPMNLYYNLNCVKKDGRF